MSYENKIEWKKCTKCGYLQHETHLRCIKCKNTKFELIDTSGECKLLTYTILKAPPSEFQDKASYALGVVEFENGIKALGQITIQENLEIGMKLRPLLKKICENLDGNEVYAYAFEPI